MSDWHFLVDRDDYRTTRVAEFAPAPLDEGEVRLRVDAFGFTANNITYAAAGDMIGYWTFFPAPDTGDDVNWGRVPVWGFADVVESRCDGVSEGERLFGYLPMSTELVILPTHVSTGSLTDGAAHRVGPAAGLQQLRAMLRHARLSGRARSRADVVSPAVLHVVPDRRLPRRQRVLRRVDGGARERVEQDRVRHGASV